MSSEDKDKILNDLLKQGLISGADYARQKKELEIDLGVEDNTLNNQLSSLSYLQISFLKASL